MKAATQERTRRLVQVYAPHCGHRWVMHTVFSDDELVERPVSCPECRRSVGSHGEDRVIHVLRSGRICAECPQVLTAHNTSKICGPCEERHQRSIAKMTEPQWRALLASQHAAVLSLLPGSFPALIVKAALMARRHPTETEWRVRGVDIQQILDAAIKAGEVVQWNPDGGRPVYRLVRQEVPA